ncbi:hypothetical protein [Mycobacterium talmoniae]|uniref:ESX-1 secretion-associated protein n=1 Tax=Mycobacterium talmoniae TaxID=1858794 RepID=A0A1S1NB02_9MYCO|nr:hypothetical protein [Mycobacterium talmoniae]OHV00147.1 hypothetical protein BKN37_18500 [Mycobacterium talmoniae]
MKQFEPNPEQLRANVDHNHNYADELRAWIDKYDDPAYYDAYATATGFIGAPMTAALREHGRRLREQTQALAARYQDTAEASQQAAAIVTGTDADGADTVTNTTRDL